MCYQLELTKNLFKVLLSFYLKPIQDTYLNLLAFSNFNLNAYFKTKNLKYFKAFYIKIYFVVIFTQKNKDHKLAWFSILTPHNYHFFCFFCKENIQCTTIHFLSLILNLILSHVKHCVWVRYYFVVFAS